MKNNVKRALVFGIVLMASGFSMLVGGSVGVAIQSYTWNRGGYDYSSSSYSQPTSSTPTSSSSSSSTEYYFLEPGDYATVPARTTRTYEFYVDNNTEYEFYVEGPNSLGLQVSTQYGFDIVSNRTIDVDEGYLFYVGSYDYVLVRVTNNSNSSTSFSVYESF